MSTESRPLSSDRGKREAVNLPNAISVLRFPLAGLFPLVDAFAGRILVVALAAASDWVDGRLARASGRVTRAGELLDPIADKTFMLAALLTLGAEGRIPLWALPLLLTRDLGVIIGAAIAAARGFRGRMPARRAGKVVTWLQFGAIAAILAWPPTARWIAPAIAVAGLIALQDYLRWFGRATPEQESRARE